MQKISWATLKLALVRSAIGVTLLLPPYVFPWAFLIFFYVLEPIVFPELWLFEHLRRTYPSIAPLYPVTTQGVLQSLGLILISSWLLAAAFQWAKRAGLDPQSRRGL